MITPETESISVIREILPQRPVHGYVHHLENNRSPFINKKTSKASNLSYGSLKKSEMPNDGINEISSAAKHILKKLSIHVSNHRNGEVLQW